MLNEELHVLLLRAFHHCNKRIVQRTSRLPLLPGQPKILEYVEENNGCIAKDICRGCVLDKSTMTSLLTRMEREGLLVKSGSPADRRAYHIFLTPKGEQAAREVKRIFSETDEKAFQGISASERAGFLSTLNKIIANLEDENE